MTSRPSREHLERAGRLLRNCFTCDGHSDTFNCPAYDPQDFRRGGSKLQADLPAMISAGLNLQLTALYVPPGLPDREGPGRAAAYLARIRLACHEHSGLRLVLNRIDLEDCERSGSLGLLVDLEGAEALCGDLGLFEVFHAAGVRCLGLTHNENNEAGGGCLPSVGGDTGLTQFGRELVRRCEESGVIVDTAHLGRKSFGDLMKLVSKPVVNSHACCAAIRDLDRNMTDEMLKAVADTGGLTGITFVPHFLRPDDSDGETIDSALVFRHIEHAVETAGIDHVGLGSDFDGTENLPEDILSPGDVVRIVARMANAGWSDEDIMKVTGGNFRRVLSCVLL